VLLVGLAFGSMFRPYALKVAGIAVVPYIAVVAFVSLALLSACGYGPYLEGP